MLAVLGNILGNFKLYAILAAIAAILSAEGFALYKAYDQGVTVTTAKYEAQLAKIAQQTAQEQAREVQANKDAQDKLNAQLGTLQSQNDALSKQLATNAKSAAADPHARTVAVSAAGVQRIRSIRGH